MRYRIEFIEPLPDTARNPVIDVAEGTELLGYQVYDSHRYEDGQHIVTAGGHVRVIAAVPVRCGNEFCRNGGGKMGLCGRCLDQSLLDDNQ